VQHDNVLDDGIRWWWNSRLWVALQSLFVVVRAATLGARARHARESALDSTLILFDFLPVDVCVCHACLTTRSPPAPCFQIQTVFLMTTYSPRISWPQLVSSIMGAIVAALSLFRFAFMHAERHGEAARNGVRAAARACGERLRRVRGVDDSATTATAASNAKATRDVREQQQQQQQSVSLGGSSGADTPAAAPKGLQAVFAFDNPLRETSDSDGHR
jgi:hypothetical protein